MRRFLSLLCFLGVLSVAATVTRGAEVTIITHGFFPLRSAPGWTYTMADAILDRADGSTSRLTSYGSIYVHDTATGGWKAASVPNRSNTDRADQHIVLIFDWATESDKQENGWLEAAADSLFAALQMKPPGIELGSGTFLSASHNLHFIGHSRGAVLNSRVCNRIGWWFPELKVDHVTSLDPHPAGPMNDFGYDSATGTGTLDTYQKVQFADNYYRRDPAGYEPGFPSYDFSGVPVRGVSFERELTETVLSASDSPNERDRSVDPSTLEHVKVHAWYHGTIDQSAALDGDEVTISSAWYVPADMGPRATTGFYYSRVASGHTNFAETSGRREPESVPVLFNGDFAFAYAPIGGITSKSIPGWEHHGGSGSAFQTSGADQSLTLNFNDSYRTHNPFYLPPNVTKLEFEYRIPNAGSNDRLKVVLTDDATFTLSIPISANQSVSPWTRSLIDVPASLQGKVVRLTFELKNTSSGVISSEVNIRNVRFTDTTAPTVEILSPASGSTVRASSFNLDIMFSETVKAYGAGKPDRADLVLSGSAATGNNVGEPTQIGRNTWRYPISGLGSGPLTARLASSGGAIQDLFDNNLSEQTWTFTVDLSVGGTPKEIITLTNAPDSYVVQLNPSVNYGSTFFMTLSSPSSQVQEGFALLKFNLAQIPAGSTVDDAVLYTTLERDSAEEVMLGKVTSAWTESGVTWSSRPSRDLTEIAVATPVTSGLSQRNFSGSLASLVSSWVNGFSQNNGLYLSLRSATTQNGVNIYSREHSVVDKRPNLIVTFTRPPDRQGDTITGLTARTKAGGPSINEREWQRDNDPHFSWNVPASQSPIVGYSWVLGTSGAQPANTATLFTPEKVFPNNFLADGVHYFRVKSVDANGNWSPSAASFELWVDTSPPALAITSPTSSSSFTIGTSTITLSGTATDSLSGVAEVSWSTSAGNNGTASRSGNNWTASNIPLLSGANTITITATDNAGNTQSTSISVTHNPPPVITIQPQGQSVSMGASVTFTFTASSPTPVAYQWRKGGVLISGATNASLTVSNADWRAAGTYTVLVTNAAGMALSQPAYLQVGSQYMFAWGYNGQGQTDVPPGLSNIVAIAASSYKTLALIQDGTMVGLGMVGATPESAQSGVVAVAGGDKHSIALKRNGTVVAWGENYDGQTNVPAGLNGVVGIAAGLGHSVALKSDGTVVAWGSYFDGSIFGYMTVPSGLRDVVAIESGFEHVVALQRDGTVVAWGNNRRGQTTIPAGLSGVIAIAAGDTHTVALKSDGTVVAWGSNLDGQRAVPAGLSGVTAIAAGGSHTIALKQDGNLVGWGNNYYRQTELPEGSSVVTGVAAGGAHTVAIISTGSAVPTIAVQPASQTVTVGRNASFAVVATGIPPFSYQWRKDGTNLNEATSAILSLGVVRAEHEGNYSVVIGNSSGIVTSAPPAALVVRAGHGGMVVAWGNNLDGQTDVPAGLSGVISVAAGWWHTVALKSDGTVVAWGGNTGGQTTVPANLSGVTAIAAGSRHTVALKSDGTVVAWGGNAGGQTTVPANLSGVTAIAAGEEHTVALKSDGTVVAWGRNDFGQTTVPAGLSGVVAIAAGGGHTLGLKANGTVVAWGGNNVRQSEVPDDLRGVVAIAAGAGYSVAMKRDGTVVAWGDNRYGQTTAPAAANGVTAVAAGGAHTLALRSDGTVVAWGENVPAGLSGVVAVAAGGSHSVALIGTEAPVITAQPLSLILPSWSNAVFNVSASGAVPFSYQWRKDSVALPGETNAQLQLTSLRRADSGLYSVAVSNTFGGTLSSNAFLRVAVKQRFDSTLRLPDGRIQLTFGDQDGGALSDIDLPFMAFWATTNLFNTNAWIRITNGIILRNGKAELTDAESVNHPRRFYLVTEYPWATLFPANPLDNAYSIPTATNSNPLNANNGR